MTCTLSSKNIYLTFNVFRRMASGLAMGVFRPTGLMIPTRRALGVLTRVPTASCSPTWLIRLTSRTTPSSETASSTKAELSGFRRKFTASGACPSLTACSSRVTPRTSVYRLSACAMRYMLCFSLFVFFCFLSLTNLDCAGDCVCLSQLFSHFI